MANPQRTAALARTALEESEMTEAMRDGAVRHLALLASGLSRDSLEHVRRLLEHMRSLEGLAPVSNTAARSHAATGDDSLR